MPASSSVEQTNQSGPRDTSPDVDHAARAMDALRRIVRSLRTADAESEATLGIGTAQLFVLRELSKAGTLTIGELARRTATAQSSVSEVVARLSAKGLLVRERSTLDRRRAAVTLSPEGRSVVTRANATIQERLLAGYHRLPAFRQSLTADGLQAWIEAAGLDDVAPTMFFES